MQPRPQVAYRESLLQLLKSLQPQRILEIGCGGGSFLRSAASLRIPLVGVDPDVAAVASLAKEGYDAQVGSADRLPFDDSSFDAGVFCFTAHHIADWSAALQEALRVSRRAVLVLDPWFDITIESQRIAEQFDRWCKKADRSTGMVHNDCMSAGALLTPIANRLADFDIGVEYLLRLHPVGIEPMQTLALQQLNKCTDPQGMRVDLDRITRSAQRSGISDDGAVLLSIVRRDG